MSPPPEPVQGDTLLELAAAEVLEYRRDDAPEAVLDLCNTVEQLTARLSALEEQRTWDKANEGMALRRLSMALTKGNAGTWDEVFDAAESSGEPS